MEIPIRNLYTHPYKRLSESDVKFIPTGIKTCDYWCNDLATKRVTVVTGVPKEGKSTFLHRVALNAVDKGFRVLLIDGEHDQTTLINKLYRMVIGNTPNSFDKVQYNKAEIIEPKEHVVDMLREWHKDRLLIFSKYLAPVDDLDELFELTELTVSSKKIDLVIFDNLMTLVNGTQVEKVENQSRFMKRTTDLAKAFNTHCIVVAHPNKNAVQGEDMGIYDVLGSSDIVNLLDYLIQIRRDFHEDDDADGYLRVLLNRPHGSNIGSIPLKFDYNRGSLFEMNFQGNAVTYDFDWEGKGKQREFTN